MMNLIMFLIVYAIICSFIVPVIGLVIAIRMIIKHNRDKRDLKRYRRDEKKAYRAFIKSAIRHF